MNIQDMFLWAATISPFRYTADKCGHRTKQTARVKAFGRDFVMRMPKNKTGSVDYCFDCIVGMTIQCAWCGQPIFIGEPVTLYKPLASFKIPKYAVEYKPEPSRLIGCSRGSCVDIDDRVGFWLPGDDGKGYVFRVPTALDILLATGENSVMMVGDLRDIREAINPTLFSK